MTGEENMSHRAVVKGTVQDRLNEIKTLRDEIRVDLHLGTLDLRDEWKNIEKKLPHLGAAAEQMVATTSETLANLMGELRKFRDRLKGRSKQRIAEIMSRAPVTCAPDESLAQAVTTMWNRDLGCLPVADSDGRALGMLTDRDAAIAACTRGSRMDDVRVDSVMSKTLVSCLPRDEVDTALGLMRVHRLRRLPVVEDDGRLVGMVTLNDAIHALREGAAHEGRIAESWEVVGTLAAITEPSETRHPAHMN